MKCRAEASEEKKGRRHCCRLLVDEEVACHSVQQEFPFSGKFDHAPSKGDSFIRRSSSAGTTALIAASMTAAARQYYTEGLKKRGLIGNECLVQF